MKAASAPNSEHHIHKIGEYRKLAKDVATIARTAKSDMAKKKLIALANSLTELADTLQSRHANCFPCATLKGDSRDG